MHHKEPHQLLMEQLHLCMPITPHVVCPCLAGLSYQLAPRAKISRRDQGGVLDLDQLKAYMRSNSWASEPFSGNSPFGAICSRGDLDPDHPKASGCNDAKVQHRREDAAFA
jgi:hypothetical protein